MQIIHVNISKEFEKGEFLVRSLLHLLWFDFPVDPSKNYSPAFSRAVNILFKCPFLSFIAKPIPYRQPDVRQTEWFIQVSSTLHVRRYKTLL